MTTLPTEAALDVTQAEIDAAAQHLRETTQAGKRLTPWGALPNSSKKKWLLLAEGTITAAARHRLASTSNSALVEAANSAVATLAAIRATASSDDWDGPETARHFHDLCGDEIKRLNAAIRATPPEQARSTSKGEGA